MISGRMWSGPPAFAQRQKNAGYRICPSTCNLRLRISQSGSAADPGLSKTTCLFKHIPEG